MKAEWRIPPTVIMANNAYYHTLLTIVLVGTKIKDDIMCKCALNLLNFRMYNGYF